jgi:hypothetical protein
MPDQVTRVVKRGSDLRGTRYRAAQTWEFLKFLHGKKSDINHPGRTTLNH